MKVSTANLQTSAVVLFFFLSLNLPSFDSMFQFGGWYQHVDSQVLPVERILTGVEEVSYDDGSVNNNPTG